MKITLDLEDSIVRAANEEALKTGRTITEVIEDSLREILLRHKAVPKKRFRLKMVTVKGSLNAGVDRNTRGNLMDR
jgi:predicted metallo-beta-lactamase superfamily hydrolase